MTPRSHIYLSYSRRIMLRGTYEIHNLMVSLVTDEGFYVTWNVTSSLVIGYQVTYHLMGSENIDELYVHYPKVHLRGLLSGAEYNVSVRAITTAFQGSVSSLKQYTVVDSPRDFRAVTVTDRSATLVWAAPEGEAVAYLLELIPVHSPSEAANTSLSNSLTTADLTGLAPLQPYVAMLYAVGHAGVSSGVSVPWITG
ncbi:fibronectin-like [Branchiostoma floridae x Branchiostoma japonicum]